eukprot:g6079.t1
MPRAGLKRKKTRTHRADGVSEEQLRRTPRCFTIKRGKVEKPLQELVQDFRLVCAPNSAIKLKESRMNKMRDYVNVASHFHVSHVNTFSQGGKSGTSNNCYFKIGKLPHGPTLSFVLKEFTTAKDVRGNQKKPRDSGKDFLEPPLLLLNGMKLDDVIKGGSTKNKKATALKLVATALKNMFPTVDVNTFTTAKCQRVALFSYDAEKELLYFRHYSLVENRNAEVSRGVQKLMRPGFVKKGKDVAAYLLNGGGADSDSEGGESIVVEETAPMRRGPAGCASIKLVEIGPRMTLQLLKGEEGFYEGAILFHEFVEKSAHEQAVLAKRLLDEQKKKDVKLQELEKDEQHRAEMKRKRQAFEEKKQAKVAERIGGAGDEDYSEEEEEVAGAEDANATHPRTKFNPFAWHRKKKGAESGAGTAGAEKTVEISGGASSRTSAAAAGAKANPKTKGAGGKGNKKNVKAGVMEKFNKSASGGKKGGKGKGKTGKPGKTVQKKQGRKGRGREKAKHGSS